MALFLLLTLLGCANQSTHLSLGEQASFPKVITKGYSAIYEAQITFNIIKAMVDPSAEITGIEIPSSSNYKIEIIDVKHTNSCWDVTTKEGYQFTPDNNQCMLMLQLTGKNIENINEVVQIKAKLENLGVPISHQLFDIPIKTEVVEQNAANLLSVEISPISIGIDIETKITIHNPNDVPINNLKIKVKDWLLSYLQNASGQSIYELGANQQFTYSFGLKSGSDTLNMLKQHQKELNGNPSTGVIEIAAANIKNIYKPDIKVILQPATLSDVIIDTDSLDVTSAMKFYNQSNTVLKITKVDTAKIPKNINIFAAVCLAQEVIAPNETCSIEVTNEGVTESAKYPIKVYYHDNHKNNYTVSSFIVIKRK